MLGLKRGQEGWLHSHTHNETPICAAHSRVIRVRIDKGCLVLLRSKWISFELHFNLGASDVLK